MPRGTSSGTTAAARPTKPKAKTRAKAARRAHEPSPPPSSALEKAHQEEADILAQSGNTGKSRRPGRSGDEMLNKQLRGHVPQFDGAATDHTVVNGRTLREQLKYDKQLVAGGHEDAPVIGKPTA